VLSYLSALDSSVLTSLYQRRLLTTSQLNRLLVPGAVDFSYLRRRLRRLVRAGVVQAVAAGRGWGTPESAWFLTAAGADTAEASGEVQVRPYRISPVKAAGPAQAHLLAVNEVGVLFVEAARGRGDECGPLDWTLEIAHRIRDGSARRFADDLLITDALLYYTLVNPNGNRVHLRFFVELDRATMTVARLARKIDQYARYYAYVPGADRRKRWADESNRPAWEEIYPRFPKLLVILTGKSPGQLENRIRDLRAYCQVNGRLRPLTSVLAMGATTLDQLVNLGPFGSITTPLLLPDPAPLDVRMRTADQPQDAG
jgi:hypothetical protein